MLCLGFEPGVDGWYAQTGPLSYGGSKVYSPLMSYITTVAYLQYSLRGQGFKPSLWPFCDTLTDNSMTLDNTKNSVAKK